MDTQEADKLLEYSDRISIDKSRWVAGSMFNNIIVDFIIDM